MLVQVVLKRGRGRKGGRRPVTAAITSTMIPPLASTPDLGKDLVIDGTTPVGRIGTLFRGTEGLRDLESGGPGLALLALADSTRPERPGLGRSAPSVR